MRKAGYNLRVKPISISIIHLGLFILTGLFLIVVYANTAVVGISGIKKTAYLLTFQNRPDLTCQFQKISDINQNSLSVSASLTCEEKSCTITVIDNKEKHSFSPVNHAGISQIDVDNFFYDTNRKLLSYTTSTPDLSSRIVMNFNGELIQSIDETPGEHRQLVLRGYQSESGMLVYFDQTSGDTYLYSIESIYFAKLRCP